MSFRLNFSHFIRLRFYWYIDLRRSMLLANAEHLASLLNHHLKLPPLVLNVALFAHNLLLYFLLSLL